MSTELAANADLEMVLREYGRVLETIPEPASDDGTGMVIDILNAKDADSLLGETELPSAADIADRFPRVEFVLQNNLIRRESTLENGLPFYVIGTLTNASGQSIRINTSAATVLAKIAKLYDFGALPARVSFTRTSKPTKAGYLPVNMTVHAHSLTDA